VLLGAALAGNLLAHRDRVSAGVAWVTLFIWVIGMLGFMWLSRQIRKSMPPKPAPEQDDLPPELASYDEARAKGELPKAPAWLWLYLTGAGALTLAAGVWGAAASHGGGWDAIVDGSKAVMLAIFFLIIAPIFAFTPFMRQRELTVPTKGAAPDGAAAAGPELAPALAELEAARRQAWLEGHPPPPRPTGAMLLGALGGLVFWLAYAFNPAVSLWVKVSGLPLLPAMGAGFAAVVAGIRGRADAMVKDVELDALYGALYKKRVLPKLAASLGQLQWRPGQPPLDEFKRYGLFPPWDFARAGDEIYGAYRNLPLSILQLNLSARQGGNATVTVFAGLMVSLALPRALDGTTVVTTDQAGGVFSQLLAHLRENAPPSGPLQPVHLEDPVFDRMCQVHATDQVMSRALLTPDFMERLKNLMQSFDAPAMLAQDNRLMMAVPTGGRDFFAPPSYNESTTAPARLARMRDDLAVLLRVADAVIDLDASARWQAAAPVLQSQ